MTHALLILLSLLYTTISYYQEMENPHLLVSDTTWTKEHFTFPISFAQEIDYEGVEEAVFSKGWGNVESQTFWTYAFAWSIKTDTPLNETDFQKNLELYFNGLLDIQTTAALFIKKEDSNTTSKNYIGKIKLLETRYTNKPMILNVLAENYYCKKEMKTIVLFKLSPKEFEDGVWQQLKNITLKNPICNQ
jgi:hypothetical protein